MMKSSKSGVISIFSFNIVITFMNLNLILSDNINLPLFNFIDGLLILIFKPLSTISNTLLNWLITKTRSLIFAP